MRALWMAAAMTAAIAASVPLTAIERMRLPAFSLSARDGRIVTTTAIARGDRWLVIYLPPGCDRCAALLEHVAGSDPLVPARLAVVVGGADAAVVAAAAGQFPGLSEAAWYGDPSGAAVAPLRLGTTPAIFGLNGSMIEWSLSGVLSPSEELRSVLANWVAGR